MIKFARRLWSELADIWHKFRWNQVLEPVDRWLAGFSIRHHVPVYQGARVFDQCAGCRPGTQWPCKHWDAALGVLDKGHPNG